MRSTCFAAVSLFVAFAQPSAAAAQELALVSEGPALQAQAVQLIVRSELMGREYRVEVTAPGRGPVFPGQKAAVVYALDGGWGLAGPVGWWLGGGGAMSPAYVVAIGNPEGQRNTREADLLPRPARRPDGSGTTAQGGRSALFTRFLVEELRPFIEARYPVDPNRSVLFGHSLAGIFTANVLADQPTAFSGYLIASPSVWADPTAPDRLRAAQDGRDRRVFVAYGEREADHMIEGGRQIAAALENRGEAARAEVFAGADHTSYYPAVMGAALPFLMPRQAPLEFPTAIELPGSAMTAFEGRYLVAGALPVEVAAQRGGLVVSAPGADPLALKPSSPTGFFDEELDVRVDFEDGGQNMVIHVNGDRFDASRVP